MRASKQKVKLKGQVTSQQDNLLSERQAALEKAQAENTTLRNELTILKADMEGKQKKVKHIVAFRIRLHLRSVNLIPKIAWFNDDI